MENLNLVELLRDCPTGMELDCMVFDNVTFDYVNTQQNRVYCKVNKSESVWFTSKGGINLLPAAKCVIFPKGNTTWEGFLPPCKFKVEKGKWYVCRKDLLDNYANKAFCKGDTYLSTQDGSLIPSNSNVPYKVEHCTDEYFRKWTISDAKDGDVLVDNLPFIFKKIDTNKYSYAYCGISAYGDFRIKSEGKFGEWTCMQDIKPATKEQRDLLFQKMKEAGYKWNPETNTLEKLPKKSKISWHTGTPKNLGYYIVTHSDGRISADIWLESTQRWDRCIESQIVAWCPVEEIEPYSKQM